MKNILTPPHAALVGALSLTALSLGFSAPAEAVTIWNWSFTTSTGNESGSGTFETADVTPEAGVTYTITGISGTYSNSSTVATITGLNPCCSATAEFQWDGTGTSPILSSSNGIFFLTSAGNSVFIGQDNADFAPVVRGGDSFGPGFSFDIASSSLQPATAVPLESDALPILGATLFMAGGLWWKRRRAKVNLDPLSAETEKSA
jgi:hypothetical protein